MENSWNTLSNYENNLILTCSGKLSIIINSTGAKTFAIADTKLYVLVVNLSAQDNAELMQQWKSGFK